jgi:uncharacterized radical SAM superfamily protein
VADQARSDTRRITDDVRELLGHDLAARLDRAREVSWKRHGRAASFYLPGMVRVGDEPVRYPAVSITAEKCDLGCAHCSGKLLENMVAGDDPEKLLAIARDLEATGALGMLISGGSNCSGKLPWDRFMNAVKEIKTSTTLRVSVHTGLVDRETARGFADAGVDAAMFDIIGSDECLRNVFHLEAGLAGIEESLDALADSGVTLYPHIVIGLEEDGLEGEQHAISLAASRNVTALSFVVFMPLRGTPMESASVPDLPRVATVLAHGREAMPDAIHALGCARPRTRLGEYIETVALLAGVDRLAVPTRGAERAARELGLSIRRQQTCCSIDLISSF